MAASTPRRATSLATLATTILVACANVAPAPDAPPPAVPPVAATATGDAADAREQAARSALSAEAPDERSEQNYHQYLQKCRADYDANNARIAASGRHDSEYVPVPGFPYLRTDRLMSSYRLEVGGDLDKLGTWMLQLREYDSIARDIELTNMGLSKAERAPILNDLRTCAVWLSDAEASDASTFKRMVEAVRVADPAVPQPVPAAAREAAARRREQVAARFAAALAPLHPKRAVRWSLGTEAVDATVPLDLSKATKDELGRVGLVMSQWPAMAEKFAPSLVTESAADGPGTPVLTAQGPDIDPRRPAIYYLPSYARVGDRMLIQMNYFLWFRDADGHGIDGLIWRVTLDERAQPLMHESIRADGFDHLWFPQPGLRARDDADPVPLIPQTIVDDAAFVVRLQPRTHDVQRLQPASAVGAVPVRALVLRPYEDLMTLKAPGGSTRSLFGADGLVAGTRQQGFTAFEAAGIAGAGAMRVWGDHRSAPLSSVYLDDPYLLDRQFTLTPPPTASTSAAAGPAVTGRAAQ